MKKTILPIIATSLMLASCSFQMGSIHGGSSGESGDSGSGTSVSSLDGALALFDTTHAVSGYIEGNQDGATMHADFDIRYEKGDVDATSAHIDVNTIAPEGTISNVYDYVFVENPDDHLAYLETLDIKNEVSESSTGEPFERYAASYFSNIKATDLTAVGERTYRIADDKAKGLAYSLFGEPFSPIGEGLVFDAALELVADGEASSFSKLTGSMDVTAPIGEASITIPFSIDFDIAFDGIPVERLSPLPETDDSRLLAAAIDGLSTDPVVIDRVGDDGYSYSLYLTGKSAYLQDTSDGLAHDEPQFSDLWYLDVYGDGYLIDCYYDYGSWYENGGFYELKEDFFPEPASTVFFERIEGSNEFVVSEEYAAFIPEIAEGILPLIWKNDAGGATDLSITLSEEGKLQSMAISGEYESISYSFRDYVSLPYGLDETTVSVETY